MMLSDSIATSSDYMISEDASVARAPQVPPSRVSARIAASLASEQV